MPTFLDLKDALVRLALSRIVIGPSPTARIQQREAVGALLEIPDCPEWLYLILGSFVSCRLITLHATSGLWLWIFTNIFKTSSEPSINVTPNSVVTLKSSMPCQAKYRWTLRNQWGLWRRREVRASFSIHESPHCGKDVCKFKSLLAPTFKKISLIPRNGLHTTDVAHYTGPSKPWAPLSPVEENALRPWLIMMEEQ